MHRYKVTITYTNNETQEVFYVETNRSLLTELAIAEFAADYEIHLSKFKKLDTIPSIEIDSIYVGERQASVLYNTNTDDCIILRVKYIEPPRTYIYDKHLFQLLHA